MRATKIIILLLAGMLAGCDSFQDRGYTIARANRRDVASVQQHLRSIAARAGIPEGAPTPNDSPTIALYRRPDVQLRASLVDHEIRIAVLRYEGPAPAAFTLADKLVRAEISPDFGARFSVDPPPTARAVIRVY